MKNLPKDLTALEKAFKNCEEKKVLIKIDHELYHDYVARSQKDITSAYNDLKNGDYHWARIKAYQALFHILNALLVKHCGYYSKDHGCVLTALLINNIISDSIASKLHLVVEKKRSKTAEDAIQDIDDLRIQRNFALYKPKAWEEVTKDDIEIELDKIKENIKILGGLL